MQKSKVVNTYYLISALISASGSFIMGFYTNFLRGESLSEIEVNTPNIVFFLVIAACEIPTGLFADMFGRKRSVILSLFISSVSFTVYGMSHGLIGYITAEIISAIGKTFSSGAFDAWLKDSLDSERQPYDLVKIYTRRNWLNRGAAVVACLIGALISKHGLYLTFYCGAISFFITTIITMLVMEETHVSKHNKSFSGYMSGTKSTCSNSWKFAKSDKNFRFVVIISSVVMFATMAPNMQWQKIAKNLGCSSAESGIIAAFISIALLMGSEIARYFKDKLKNRRLEIVITQMFVGLNIALVTTFMSRYPIITFFLLHEIGRGTGDVLRGAFIQECIPSKEERATLGSFVSMVEHLCGAAGLIMSGLMADKYGYNPAWVISGTALVLVTLALLPQCRKE